MSILQPHVVVAAPHLEQVCCGINAHLSLFEGFATGAGGPLGWTLQYPILQVQLLRPGGGVTPAVCPHPPPGGSPREEEHRGPWAASPQRMGSRVPARAPSPPVRGGGGRAGRWINGLLLGEHIASPAAQQPLCLQRLPEPINTLSPALITPLSAPNQANTSGEFKPLTSQKFLCNNRLSFWRFNSIHGGQPSGVARGLPRADRHCSAGPSWMPPASPSPRGPDWPSYWPSVCPGPGSGMMPRVLLSSFPRPGSADGRPQGGFRISGSESPAPASEVGGGTMPWGEGL